MESLHTLDEMYISQRYVDMDPPVLRLARGVMQFLNGFVGAAECHVERRNLRQRHPIAE